MAPPVQPGPPLPWRPVGVAQAPGDATWAAAAAKWSLGVAPARVPVDVSNLFLRIAYTGDEARLGTENRVFDDDFYNGESWLIGLNRYRDNSADLPLRLQILPLRADSPVYLPPSARKAEIGRQVAEVGSVAVLPQYQIQFTYQPPKAASLGAAAIDRGPAAH